MVVSMESSITRAENPPYYSGSQECRSILQEIREIKRLLGEIQELYRRVDARLNGLAHWCNQNRREDRPR